MSVKIFAMTHKRFEVPGDPMYIPLHVGHRNAKEDFGYLGDDTGDNISALNGYYAELSGVYWVWKNYKAADIVGVCHYRRFLTSEAGYVFSEAEYERILTDYDIVTTKQLALPGSYRDGFGAHHKVETLDETGRIIAARDPACHEAFVRLVHQNKTYFGNIMVAKKELYDAYCEWLFSIFFELQQRIDLTFEDDYHKRVFGFISEFLLYVWVQANKLKAFECRVAVIGEKQETKEVTRKMADFFQKRDAAGARAYFEAVLKQRPDILMEASDINGECKLCLQAVSTANLELATYGHCFLEQVSGYADVIHYFRQLNSFAASAVRAVLTESEAEKQSGKAEYVQTIKAAEASDMAGHRKEARPPVKASAESDPSLSTKTAAESDPSHSIKTAAESDPSFSIKASAESESSFLAMTQITEVALRAAIRLFAQSPEIAERAYQFCNQAK